MSPLLLLLAAVASSPSPRSATVPFSLDHNRIIVELELVGPHGARRTVPAWVDTGNPFLILGESLARELGLELPPSEELGSGHSAELDGPAPGIRVGGLALDVTGIGTRIRRGRRVMPGIPAEATLPATALRGRRVVFDYPARRLTVSDPGPDRPRGVAIPCRVNAETGLFLITATLDGEAVSMGVDTGSAGTWVSQTLTAAWQERHPDWSWCRGAAGSANFFGFDFEAAGVLLRLPSLGLGSLTTSEVAVLGLDQGMFDWYSRKSAGSVVGFIGANVLRHYRLEVDYPNQMTYWEAAPAAGPADLDIVGITLRPEPDGRFAVAGVLDRQGKRAVGGVSAGDVLLGVDSTDAPGATMGTVVEALRGSPGEIRVLHLERDAHRLDVEAHVAHLP